MVETFLIKGIQYSTKVVANDADYSDLYGGGRNGAKEELNTYKNSKSSDEDDDQFEREQQAKKATNEFIQKQFALRRNTQEVSQKTVDKLFSKHSRVQAASSTSSKVKGLTLATREQYLSKILDLLYTNYTECQEEPTLDKKDVEDCAIELEYSVFTVNTNLTMYRNSLAKTISNIKRCTDDKIVYESLLTFEPKPAKHETLSDLFRNITKEQQLKRNTQSDTEEEKVYPAAQFKSATQVLSENRTKLSRNQSTISDFFRKRELSTEDKSEVKSDISDSGENSGVESEEDQSEKVMSRKDLKSLFGDDDSDEDAFLKEENSTHSSSKASRDFKDLFEDPEVSKHKRHEREPSRERDKDRHGKDDRDRHRHRDREESERKRRKSHDRDDDRKRRKEEDKHKKERNNTESKPSSSESPDKSGHDKHSDMMLEHSLVVEENLQDTTEVRDESSLENNNRDTMGAHEEVTRPEVVDFKEKISEIRVAKQNGESSKKPRLKKTEIGGLVVKLLTPAYAERRFESRDIFKTMARTISHRLADKDENEIKRFVEDFLKRNEEITSQTTI